MQPQIERTGTGGASCRTGSTCGTMEQRRARARNPELSSPRRRQGAGTAGTPARPRDSAGIVGAGYHRAHHVCISPRRFVLVSLQRRWFHRPPACIPVQPRAGDQLRPTAGQVLGGVGAGGGGPRQIGRVGLASGGLSHSRRQASARRMVQPHGSFWVRLDSPAQAGHRNRAQRPEGRTRSAGAAAVVPTEPNSTTPPEPWRLRAARASAGGPPVPDAPPFADGMQHVEGPPMLLHSYWTTCCRLFSALGRRPAALKCTSACGFARRVAER